MKGHAAAQKWPQGMRACVNIGCLTRQGALAGIIAGISFAMFEMMVAWLVQGDFFGPLRMIGAMILGREALGPSYSLLLAAMAGIIIHAMLSIIYGAAFSVLLAYAPSLAASPGSIRHGYGNFYMGR